MTTHETVREYSLPLRLMTELDFQIDERNMQWLYHDEMNEASGIDGPEYLPSRVRVSSGGDRLEFGVRKQDLNKTLELARMIGKDTQSIDFIRAFWPEDSRISVNEDDEWLFVGAPIEPTAEDFELEFSRIELGLEVALSGALEGKTYEEMKAHDWYDAWVEEAETKSVNRGPSQIFPRKPIEVQEEKGGGCPDWWDRHAENLKAYNIETWNTFVGNAATEFRIGDKVYIGSGLGHLTYQETRDGDKSVEIRDHGFILGVETGYRWALNLHIPEAMKVKTVEDAGLLKQATLTLREESRDHHMSEPNEQQLSVNVSVEDHKVTVESEDGEYSMTYYEPACMRCETPIWKFKWPEGVEGEGDSSKASMGIGFGGDIVMDGGSGSSNGVYSYSVGKYERGKRSKKYCHDCFCDVREEFATEYPLARRENALAAVRAKLDQIGYGDVQLKPDQVWPSWAGDGDTIEMFAYIEYERDGRKIFRRVARPLLKYSGEITFPDLPSREYVEFR